MPSVLPEWIAMEMFLSSLPPLSPPLSVRPLLEPLSELPPLLDPLSSEPHAASVRAAAAPSAAIDRKRLFFLIISFHERFSTVRDCFEVCVVVACGVVRNYSERALLARATAERFDRPEVTRSR